VLENVQQRAAQSNDRDDAPSKRTQLNVTIRDRYFGALMTAPRSVFPQLMHLKNAHLKKINRKAPKLARYFERRIDDILDAVRPSEGLPAALSLEEQGRFILGYHHQRNSWRDRAGDRAGGEPGDLPEA
jgi:CRISPR-associated protein Csd1